MIYPGFLQRIDQHKDGLEKSKSEYEELKKTVDELRASEVLCQLDLYLIHFVVNLLCYTASLMEQVDADYKLKDTKKIYKELEMKGKGYKKKLDDLHNDLSKQMEQ